MYMYVCVCVCVCIYIYIYIYIYIQILISVIYLEVRGWIFLILWNSTHVKTIDKFCYKAVFTNVATGY
jgi:hypothetical protein